MIVVGVGLVALPFGKLFHPLQRPVAVGVGLVRDQDASDPVECRSCGRRSGPPRCSRTSRQPWPSSACLPDRRVPACKRLDRGTAYRALVKEGYR